MAIDFREIPPGNKSEFPDAFELFARDFFEALGYRIIRGPGRGPDKGIDLLISEERKGIDGSSTFQFTVSCKHNAHSLTGNSVGVNEDDFSDRVVREGSQGFIGFYSTVPSTPLISRIENMMSKVPEFKEYKLFDYAEIEKRLTLNSRMFSVYKQHLPESYRKILKGFAKSNVYPNEPAIGCDECKTDILLSLRGAVAHVTQNTISPRNGSTVPQLLEVCFACDECRDSVEEKALRRHSRGGNSFAVLIYWREIADYCKPEIYIRQLRNDLKFIAYHKNYFVGDSGMRWLRFFEAMFYYVSRPEPGRTFSESVTFWERYEL